MGLFRIASFISSAFLAVCVAHTFIDETLGKDVDPAHVKVVVVGAGAAGLSAADKLSEAGFDVTVVEAQGRIGGRIKSIDLKGISEGFVEEGAQLLYGFGKLPRILKDLGWTKEVDEFKDLFLSESRGRLDEDDTENIKKGDELFQGMFEPLEDGDVLTEADRKTRSVGAYLDYTYKDLLRENSGAVDKELVQAAYDSNIRAQRMLFAADSLYDVAVDSYEKLRFGLMRYFDLTVPFTKVVQFLGKNIPKGKILLNKPVTNIKFTPKLKNLQYPITISLEDRTRLLAHHVIFTGSLGVLKAHHKTLFTPELTPQKQAAIEALGFGKQEKIFLVYEEPWWKKFDEGISCLRLLWDKDLKVDTERRYADKPWYRTADGPNTLPSAPNVLEVLISGDAVEKIKVHHDNYLVEQLTKLFKEFTKDETIPEPKMMHKTSYASNPYFLGSKSYISFASKEADVSGRNLTKSSWQYEHQGYKVPGLLFAGEATHPDYFSTIQGAVESGWREAHRLMKAYDIPEGPKKWVELKKAPTSEPSSAPASEHEIHVSFPN